MHKAILDITTRVVHLYSPVYGKVIFHLTVIARIKASLHHVVELKLEVSHPEILTSECEPFFPQET
jgi:hypothetical protein